MCIDKLNNFNLTLHFAMWQCGMCFPHLLLALVSVGLNGVMLFGCDKTDFPEWSPWSKLGLNIKGIYFALRWKKSDQIAVQHQQISSVWDHTVIKLSCSSILELSPLDGGLPGWVLVLQSSPRCLLSADTAALSQLHCTRLECWSSSCHWSQTGIDRSGGLEERKKKWKGGKKHFSVIQCW